MRRAGLPLLIACLVAGPIAPAQARPAWKVRVDRLIGDRNIGVFVAEQGVPLYRHSAQSGRVPASNEKLLLSMPLLDALGPNGTIKTAAAALDVSGTLVPGDLWVLGHGDPTVTGGGRYGRELPFEATRLGKLARAVKAAGITRIAGNVMGSTGYFSRDHWAQGWKSDFPERYIPLPTSLTYEGNVDKGRHITDPEFRAARLLKRKLRAIGVQVDGGAGMGPTPAGLTPIARVSSQPLVKLLTYMNRRSSNFFAEVLGKRLGVERFGAPGTIAKGARAVAAWAAGRGVDVTAYDSSGLSYGNRVSPAGLVALLDHAEDQTWGEALRRSLASGGQGTLDDRLRGVKVKAKTGTLTYISTLSGYVWADQMESWIEFSIMSSGMYKETAADIEDQIVRILATSAS